MPEFEFSDGSSNKFWKIELDGSCFTARWGRIGTKGQEKRQDFATPEEAKREYDKLIASKLKKGYRRVDVPEKAVETGGFAELEEAALQNPDDPKGYLVLADALQSKGDPRGELIAIQHARLTADTPELKQREEQLLAGQTLFGELAPLLKKDAGLSVWWHLGYLRKVRLARDVYGSEIEVGETLSAVLALPIGKRVEEVVIGMCDEPGDGDFQEAIDALIETAPKTLRTLFLGDFKTDQSDMSATGVGDLSKLYAALPKLRSLKLRGGSATLGTIAMPELREFTFETGALARESFESIASARWPSLEKLSVWFGDENYGAECEFDDLTPVLQGRGLGSLRALGLVNSGFITRNIAELAKAKVLAQLHSLDLSLGTLDDEDAEAFVRHAAAFKHLQHLDVSTNYLTQRGVWLLRKVVKDVTSTEQNPRGLEDNRFVAVGE